MALVSPTIQINVTITLSHCASMWIPKISVIMIPRTTGMAAATNCPINLSQGLSAKISSKMPSITMSAAPHHSGRNCKRKVSTEISLETTAETVKPKKMASPPIKGIGFLCMRRLSLGTSTALIRNANFFTRGVVANAVKNAVSSARIRW